MSTTSKQRKMKKARKDLNDGKRVAAKSISAMRREYIAEKVAAIVSGSRVTVRFGRNADPTDLGYLGGMFRSGGITVASSQLTLFSTIARSRDWGGAQNRVVKFGATHSFDQRWFKDRIMRRIDYINVE